MRKDMDLSICVHSAYTALLLMAEIVKWNKNSICTGLSSNIQLMWAEGRTSTSSAFAPVSFLTRVAAKLSSAYWYPDVWLCRIRTERSGRKEEPSKSGKIRHNERIECRFQKARTCWLEIRRTWAKGVGSLLKAAHFVTFIPDRQGWESSAGAKWESSPALKSSIIYNWPAVVRRRARSST